MQRSGGRPTIRDVAASAGVSTATVSRVVNGSPGVDATLRLRVDAAVSRLGYRPSSAARRLASGLTGLVGVVVPDLTNPFFHAVLKGITAAADTDGYRVVVADTGESVAKEAEIAHSLLDRADSLVLCSPRMPDQQLRALAAGGRPIVCLNRSSSRIGVPAVNIEEYEGALALAGHLRELGHERVLYLHGPDGSWSDGERSRALDDAASFGLAVDGVACGSDLDAGATAVNRIVDAGVTAVVAFNDYVALGAIAGLRTKQLRVPDDVSVAGFDDIPFARFGVPTLTTVRRPVRQLGESAYSYLRSGSLSEATFDPSPLRLRNEVVVRDSTAPPRRGATNRISRTRRPARAAARSSS